MNTRIDPLTAEEVAAPPTPSSVRIVDFNMPFGSLVGFMVKAALAAIPALIILSLIAAAATAVLTGIGKSH